jgi:outer membrane protein
MVAGCVGWLLAMLVSNAVGMETNAPSPARPMPAGGPPPGWGAGVAVLAANSPYRDSNPLVLPIPMVTYVGDRFSWMGPRASWRLGRVAGVRVSAVATYQFAGAFSRGDSDYFDGMRDPKGTLEGGLEIQSRLPGGLRGQASVKSDLLGIHNGQEAAMTLSRGWTVGAWTISPGLGLTSLSGNMVRYYFGVRPGEARPDRPAYSPGATVNGGPRLTLNWQLNERVGVFSLCSVDFLGDEITGSPLVEEEKIFSTLTALVYRF